MLCVLKNGSEYPQILLRSQISIPVNADVELAFNPGEEARNEFSRSIRFGGHVVRSHSGGVGVNFTTFYDGAFAYLKRLVAD